VGSAGETEAGVAALAARDPELALPLADAPGYTRADVAYACTDEGACRLSDVIDRRLRLGINLDAVPDTTVRAVAEVMGSVLGWDDSRVEREVDGYSVSHVPL
jgi:glycerol-3-phosphate dehydrogenase